MTSSCSFNSLPPEIQLHILGMVPPKDLLASSSVSKQWNALASDQQLWKEIVIRNFKKPVFATYDRTRSCYYTYDWKHSYRLEVRHAKRLKYGLDRMPAGSYIAGRMSSSHVHDTGGRMIADGIVKAGGYCMRVCVFGFGLAFFGVSGLALAGYGSWRLMSNLYYGDDPQVSIAMIVIGISLPLLAPAVIAKKLGF